ncbi:MAG: hypothetical protein QOF14_3705 [Hyphomicrobiales bacterium]|jgi:hypothetical protein|nr:hypothetical protein [Hyphomicrobiales bacterium]
MAARKQELHMPKETKRCHVGLDQRCRDLDGEIRQKRGDTLVGTLRKSYGPEFASGVRSDMRLDTLRQREGGSLSKILRGK